jgi:hypothetical protein
LSVRAHNLDSCFSQHLYSSFHFSKLKRSTISGMFGIIIIASQIACIFALFTV